LKVFGKRCLVSETSTFENKLNCCEIWNMDDDDDDDDDGDDDDDRG